MPAARRSCPRAIADRLGLALEDPLSVATVEGGTIPLRVAGIAERTIPGRDGEAVLVGWADATTHLGVAGADAFAVRFDPASAGHGRGRPLGRPRRSRRSRS